MSIRGLTHLAVGLYENERREALRQHRLAKRKLLIHRLNYIGKLRGEGLSWCEVYNAISRLYPGWLKNANSLEVYYCQCKHLTR